LLRGRKGGQSFKEGFFEALKVTVIVSQENPSQAIPNKAGYVFPMKHDNGSEVLFSVSELFLILKMRKII